MLDGLGRLLRFLVRLAVRYFVTGQSLLGRPTDNATMFHAATVDHRGNPYEKLSGPRIHRLARRWAVAGVPLSLMAMSVIARVWQDIAVVDPPWVLVGWRAMALRWWIVLTLGLAAFYGWRGVQFLRHRKVTDEFVYPAWEAACDAMGYKFRASDARRMVSLPEGFDSPQDTEHGRLTGWYYRRRERKREAKGREAAQYEADSVEPSTELVPVSTDPAEVAVYKQPPWAGLLPRRHAKPEADEEDPVRITLIPGKCSTEAERKRFVQKVAPVLGMVDSKGIPDAVAKWYMRGRSPYVELRPNHPPPPEFSFAHFRKYLDQADLGHIPIGLSHGGVLEFIDFVEDTAHLLISALSGRGKTNLAKLLGAIFMWLGAALVVLDFKVVSHRWAHNLPGCNYAWEIEAIHDLLVAIGGEIYRRKTTAIPDGADVDTPLNKFTPLVVFVEESNALADQLRDYWAATRRQGDPAQSPALAAMRAAVYTGREFGICLVPIAQRASTSIFGANGGDARESLGTRILGGWTPQAWKMLAFGLPFIFCPKGKGVFSIVQNDGRAPIVRVPYITDREARDLAMSGVPSPGQVFGGEVVEGPVVEQVTPTEPELVDLRAVVEGNMLPGPSITWEAIRKASQRGGRVPFPKPAGMLGVAAGYRLADLIEWKNARDGVRSPPALADTPDRPGIVYQFNTLDPDNPGEIEIGYIGQTRWIHKREDQHRGDKPWSDLIVGDPIIIWESACTNPELDDAEMAAIHRLKPRYNYLGQEGAPHAMPLYEQVEQRQLRNRARGLPPWEPENRYEMSQLAQLSHAGTG